MSTDGLIILTDSDEQQGPRPTMIRVVENRLVTEEAEQGLHVPAGSTYIARGDGLEEMQFGVIETPLGYIVTDYEGGHLKLPQEKDDRVTLLVWSRRTRRPLAENQVTVGHVLQKYCRQTMPVADFISNRDGMEVRWRQLLITLVSCGVDTGGDVERRAQNDRGRLILGGSLPLDPKKL